MSRRPPLHLSPLWDTEGLCSDSATNPPLNKGSRLTEQASREDLRRELSFGSDSRKWGLSHLKTLKASGGSQCAQSWNHSENRTHHHESRLKIDSWKYIGTDKRPLFGKRQWATHTLACMHTETVETFLDGQWEYVSACYSLLFAVSTFTWVVQVKHVFQGSGRLHKQRASLSSRCNQLNSWRRRRKDRKEMCSAISCPRSFSLPCHSFFLLFSKCCKDARSNFFHSFIHSGEEIVHCGCFKRRRQHGSKTAVKVC